jgi:hypothetical protein
VRRGAGALILAASLTSAAPGRGDDSLVATPDKPANVPVETVGPPPADGRSPYVVIDVTGFDPPRDGSTIRAEVKVGGDGPQASRVVGQFGIFPSLAFKAEDRSEAQRFLIPLDDEAARALAQGSKLTIDLIPQGGSGQDARMQLGGAELRR